MRNIFVIDVFAIWAAIYYCLWSTASIQGTPESIKFVKVKEDWTSVSSIERLGVRSKLECSQICGRNSECHGFNYMTITSGQTNKQCGTLQETDLTSGLGNVSIGNILYVREIYENVYSAILNNDNQPTTLSTTVSTTPLSTTVSTTTLSTTVSTTPLSTTVSTTPLSTTVSTTPLSTTVSTTTLSTTVSTTPLSTTISTTPLSTTVSTTPLSTTVSTTTLSTTVSTTTLSTTVSTTTLSTTVSTTTLPTTVSTTTLSTTVSTTTLSTTVSTTTLSTTVSTTTLSTTVSTTSAAPNTGPFNADAVACLTNRIYLFSGDIVHEYSSHTELENGPVTSQSIADVFSNNVDGIIAAYRDSINIYLITASLVTSYAADTLVFLDTASWETHFQVDVGSSINAAIFKADSGQVYLFTDTQDVKVIEPGQVVNTFKFDNNGNKNHYKSVNVQERPSTISAACSLSNNLELFFSSDAYVYFKISEKLWTQQP